MLSTPGAFQAIMGYLNPGETIRQVAVLTTGPSTSWYAGVTAHRLIAVQLDPVWCEPIPKTRFAVPLSELQVNIRDVLITLPGQAEPQAFHMQTPSASVPSPWDIAGFKAALQNRPVEPESEPALQNRLIEPEPEPAQIESKLAAGGLDAPSAATTARTVQRQVADGGHFISGHSQAQAVTRWFVVHISLTLVCVVAGVLIALFLRPGPAVTASSISISDLISFGILGLWVIAAFQVWTRLARWIYRVYGNLPALGASELETTLDRAAGGLFFFRMNLNSLYQILPEVWILSDPTINLANPVSNDPGTA